MWYRSLCVTDADESCAGRGDIEGEGQMRESRDEVEPTIVVADDENKDRRPHVMYL
jgi:hypothetical protein